MPECPNYKASPQFQLGTGATAPFDCTAFSAAIVADAASCGAKKVTGTYIRKNSSEPKPDPTSPGLNLVQVSYVLEQNLKIPMDVNIGANKISWAAYEARRKAGRPTIIQVGYSAIADSPYDAGNGFRGNHALAETLYATYDPLADGRGSQFRYNGYVYDREVIKNAAGRLDIGSGRRVGYGYVWAAFANDVVPIYTATIQKPTNTKYRTFFVYTVGANGQITGRTKANTGGFSATCTAPTYYYWPLAHKNYRLVQLTSGSRKGQYISSEFAKET